LISRAFLERRIADCAKQRGQPVSLIATDFYEQGDLIDVAREINAQPVGRAGP
jgi:hypothetical protein